MQIEIREFSGEELDIHVTVDGKKVGTVSVGAYYNRASRDMGKPAGMHISVVAANPAAICEVNGDDNGVYVDVRV